MGSLWLVCTTYQSIYPKIIIWKINKTNDLGNYTSPIDPMGLCVLGYAWFLLLLDKHGRGVCDSQLPEDLAIKIVLSWMLIISSESVYILHAGISLLWNYESNGT